MSVLATHRKPLLIAVLFGFALVLTVWLAGSRHNGLAEARAEGYSMTGTSALRVTTWVVAPESIADIAEVTGTVVAAQRAELSPKIMGRVSAIYVHEGQQVRKGQVLVQLEAADLAAGVAQASASTGAASAALAQAQTASILQREQSRSRIEQATAALRQAQAHLSKVLEGSRTQEKAVAAQAIAMAEAEARNAEANYGRYQKLYEQGVVSAMEADRYRTASDVAKAHLETARQQASLAYEGSRKQEIDTAQAQLLQAQDAVRLAKASVAENRMKQDQVRLARAQLVQASAARSGASVQYSYSRIVAPFSGVVTARMVDPGDLASPGHPLIVVEDTSQYRLEASVPEDTLRHLYLGQSVPVSLDLLGQPLLGQVSRIIPSADPSSRTFTVKVDLPKTPGVSSGIFGRLQIEQGAKKAIEVPATAIVQRGQLSLAYIVDHGKAQLRIVTVGSTQNGKTEVLSGIQPGEHVVIAPIDRLQDGQAVREVTR